MMIDNQNLNNINNIENTEVNQIALFNHFVSSIPPTLIIQENTVSEFENEKTLENNCLAEGLHDYEKSNENTNKIGVAESVTNKSNGDKTGQEKSQINNKGKKKRRIVINDSDSEEELATAVSPIIEENEVVENFTTDNNAESKRLTTADSDEDYFTKSFSEDNADPSDVFSKDRKKHKRLTIIDSDSELETEVAHSQIDKENPEQAIYTTNFKGELVLEKSKPKWSTLCDSESSEDEINIAHEIDEENRYSNEEKIEPKQYKKRRKPKNAEDKPKKMTGKEAAELRKEIQSESQRMVREMNVSLPYHKPKQFTLKEFLSRRPKLASAATTVAARTPPSVALKLSTEQLEIFSKKMKEREKEVKEFYKSESEADDDEDDQDYVPPDSDTMKSISALDCKETHETNAEDILDLDGNKQEDSGIDSQEVIGESLVKEDSQVATNFDGDSDSSDKPGELLVEMKDTDIYEAISINSEREATQNLINKPTEVCVAELPENDSPLGKGTTGSIMIDETVEHFTTDYEFNLDDLEENSERINSIRNGKDIDGQSKESNKKELSENSVILENIEENQRSENAEIQLIEDTSRTQSTSFMYTELDKEIEAFDSSEVQDNKKIKLSKLDLLKEKLACTQPRLSGGPNDIIDLEIGVVKPNEVSKLIERFAQHTAKKYHHKNKVKLDIVSVESGEIHKETVAMNVDEDDDPNEIEEKPGAKLHKLRDELQNKIAQRRSQLWQRKSTVEVTDGEKDPCEDEKSDCGANGDDILDDEDEEEMSESSAEEDDEIDDNEDLVNREKLKPKSAFIDEEAEESDIENEADESVDADDEEDENETAVIVDQQFKSSVDEKLEKSSPKKIMRRIIKRFVDDSDDEDDESFNLPFASRNNINMDSNSGKNAELDINGAENVNKETQDDEEIPAHQPQSSQTPNKQADMTQIKSKFDFFTPISYITGLQNLNCSAAKSIKESPKISPFKMATVPSPLKDANWHSDTQKKLFSGSEITESQAEAIEDLCSNKLPSMQVHSNVGEYSNRNTIISTQLEIEDGIGTLPVESEVEDIDSSLPPSSQDLLNICSGAFTGITQVSENTAKNAMEMHTFKAADEVKSLDADQDMIISQLINEEEMEEFRKKFDSPLMSNTQRRIIEEFQEVTASGGIIDSDDDDEDDILEVKKKKNQKKLTFSDDESSEGEEPVETEEEINLHDESDEDEDGNSVAADNIDYDSEENEIERISDKNIPRLKPSDFFENEAELSESEWGSADEDEKDLDTMEFEQGDTEKFDEKQIRNDLEKIHTRRMLDDDTREVKLLQELFLEDGELHGTGRERQFRWKNIDSMDNAEEEKIEDDEVYLDEEESEEQWRKRRYEREMFLQEKQKKSQEFHDDDNLLSDSQLLKIGREVIQRSQSSSNSNTPGEKPEKAASSPDVKCTFSLSNKRGSFLSRGDQVLQRLTEFNKVTTTVALGTAKHSRNFVFQSVSVEGVASITQVNKRKANNDTPNAIKKLRLSDNLSPAVRKEKKPGKPSAKAKLFGSLW